jgi:hypothetical protein
MTTAHWSGMPAKATFGIALLACISGCVVHVQRAQVRIADDLATTFKISATLRPAKDSMVSAGPEQSLADSADAEAAIRERAEACGATYKSYRRPNGKPNIFFTDEVQLEIERRYSTAHELDEGLRCADLGQPPAGYRLEKTDGLLKKTLTIAFDLPITHYGAGGKGRFPDEVVIIMPWKIARVEDRTESSFGKLQHTVLGDDQVRMQFVEDPSAIEAYIKRCLSQSVPCDTANGISSIVRMTIVAEKFKVELQTMLTIAGILLSIVTLLFGSGIARKRLENRRASHDAKGE